MISKQNKIVLLSCFVLALFLSLLYFRSKTTEGFADPVEAKKSFNPELASYQLLTSVMGPLRRISKVVLNPANWKERITMATMSPTDLARMYLKAQTTKTE